MFLCPNTGLHVHERFDEDADYGEDTYLTVACLACSRLHLVNPSTGRVISGQESK